MSTTLNTGLKLFAAEDRMLREGFNENTQATHDRITGHSHDGEPGNGGAVSEWAAIQDVTYARVSGNTFTVTTDRTDTYKAGRLVKITSGDPTTESVTRVTAVSYDDLDETTTVVLEDSIVGTPLTKAQYAILDQVGTAIYGYVDTTAFLMSIIFK